MGVSGRDPTPPGGEPTRPRHLAALILDAVLSGRRPFDRAWAEQAEALGAISRRDRAFTRLLVATALRRRGEIDHLLAGLLRRPPEDKAALVHQILRLGVAQLRFLGTPPHAAIDQAVRLTRQCGRGGMAGLVNAVLRKIPGLAPVSVEDAAVLNTPPWLLESWRSAHGAATAAAIARAHLSEPPLDLSIKADADRWARTLGGHLLPTGSVRVHGAGDITTLPGFAEGAWWVQDAAAALPARLLAPPSGARVFDLCAAPGGKTAQLAVMGADVTAVEADPRRVALLRDNLARLNLTANIIEGDAATFTPGQPAQFILLDAPCTATGTLRRHPDIAWLKSPDDVTRMTVVQDRLLRHAAGLLAPGGVLVYAVCSLQPEEGAARVEALLARDRTVARMPLRPEEVPGLESAITPVGDLATHPALWAERGRIDGFYVGRIQKA